MFTKATTSAGGMLCDRANNNVLQIFRLSNSHHQKGEEEESADVTAIQIIHIFVINRRKTSQTHQRNADTGRGGSLCVFIFSAAIVILLF